MEKDSSKDFQLIIEGCCKRDRSSQNALYKLYYPYAMSVCIRYTESNSEAICVVNDSFLKVFNNIKKFGIDRPFKPWFRRILVNTAINHVKKQKKFKKEVAMDEARTTPYVEDVLSQINYRELIALVQSLSQSYRTVFNMYVIDGYKHKEIAKILGISESTSKSNLTRARAKLQELVTAKLNNPYV